MRMSDEAWADVLNVNLTGAFCMARAVLRPTLKARGGRIINMSSVSGQIGNAGQANYSTSKAGLIGLTKALAREVASRGITVNAVAPGFLVTDLTDGLPDSVKDAIRPQRRRLAHARPTTSRPPSPSSPPTRRPTSRARSSASTAAS
jgi:3-oxoacyl-[acyl-carrier protein] reductase